MMPALLGLGIGLTIYAVGFYRGLQQGRELSEGGKL